MTYEQTLGNSSSIELEYYKIGETADNEDFSFTSQKISYNYYFIKPLQYVYLNTALAYYTLKNKTYNRDKPTKEPQVLMGPSLALGYKIAWETGLTIDVNFGLFFPNYDSHEEDKRSPTRNSFDYPTGKFNIGYQF